MARETGTLRLPPASGQAGRCLVTGLLLTSMVSAGCPSADRVESQRLTRIQELEDENARLKRDLAARDEQQRDLAATIQSLRQLGPGRTMEDIVRVARVEIERLSGGYDHDRDGIDDGVVVYLRLFDQFGGTIRASGTARVKVFDPANPEDRNLVAEHEWSHEALRELWAGRFLTAHYTLHVPWPSGRTSADHAELVAFASFTDLLTGQTFTDQRPVTVRTSASGPAAALGP